MRAKLKSVKTLKLNRNAKLEAFLLIYYQGKSVGNIFRLENFVVAANAPLLFASLTLAGVERTGENSAGKFAATEAWLEKGRKKSRRRLSLGWKKCLDEIKFKFQTIHIRCNISTDRTQRDFHFSPIGGKKEGLDQNESQPRSDLILLSTEQPWWPRKKLTRKYFKMRPKNSDCPLRALVRHSRDSNKRLHDVSIIKKRSLLSSKNMPEICKPVTGQGRRILFWIALRLPTPGTKTRVTLDSQGKWWPR